ncbi:hypothetical protein HH1059_11330 [Halorhodospira halochloris]|uniref:Uncharacterized protein n=1 Tax=Halorhodospira halochloris TaxID=1052 RepID=A0A2Z6EZG4_HALHR|nr:hypothetical protein HH1059_11330 [Halorhodospira halochloris]
MRVAFFSALLRKGHRCALRWQVHAPQVGSVLCAIAVGESVYHAIDNAGRLRRERFAD